MTEQRSETAPSECQKCGKVKADVCLRHSGRVHCTWAQLDALRSSATLEATMMQISPSRPNPELRAWRAMRQRCLNPNDARFAAYGGRGIRICARWSKSALFLLDMGPRPSPDHSLDRIDNNGDYTPENCRWATRLQQQQNMRRNRLISFGGETMPTVEWCRRLGLEPATVATRLARGWSVDRALQKPRWSRKVEARA